MTKKGKIFISILLCVVLLATVFALVGCEKPVNEQMSLYEIKKYGSDYAVSSLTPEIFSVKDNKVTAIAVGEGKLLVNCLKENTQKEVNVTVKAEYPYGMQIKNYNNDKIENFIDNKFAFIVTAEDGVVIKDNEITLAKNQGIYSYGEHKISVTKDNNTRTFAVNILPPTKTDGKTYDIIATYATLPTLYAGLNLVANDNEKFIWFGRSGTLSEDILKSNSNITLSKHIGDSTKLAIDVVNEIKNYCYKVMSKDANAKFRLYVDDFRHWIEISTFAEMGLQDDRYEVYYCSDGTYTYTKAYSYRNGPYSIFENVIESRNDMIKSANSNAYANDLNDSYLNNGAYTQMDFYDDFILVGAQKDNIYYWAQYPEYCTSTDEKIQGIFYEAIDKKLPELMYKSLTEKQKKYFLSLINFDKETFDKEYFNAENDKPYLIVTGTNPYTTNTYRYIEIVSQKYGQQYNIVFKPHPSAIPVGEDLAKLDMLGVKVLPGKLPMEALLWVYPDYKVGGYNSSLYMSAPQGNTLFFFAENKDALSSPLKELYNALFSNAEFITLT